MLLPFFEFVLSPFVTTVPQPWLPVFGGKQPPSHAFTNTEPLPW